jgi:hypothetical protein
MTLPGRKRFMNGYGCLWARGVSAVPYDPAERKGAEILPCKGPAMLAAESTAGHAFAKSSCQFEVRECYERASDGKFGG